MTIKNDPSINPFYSLPEKYKTEEKVNKPFSLPEKYSSTDNQKAQVSFENSMEQYSQKVIKFIQDEEPWIEPPAKKEIS